MQFVRMTLPVLGQPNPPVHVISLHGLSLPRINDVSHPILCDISPLVQHLSLCDDFVYK